MTTATAIKRLYDKGFGTLRECMDFVRQVQELAVKPELPECPTCHHVYSHSEPRFCGMCGQPRLKK